MQGFHTDSSLSVLHRYCRNVHSPILTLADLDAHYRRLRVLGEGTYGIVYEAIHVLSGRKVALKKLRTDETENSMEQIGIPTTAIRETVLLRELHHPNIVQLFEVAHIGAQLWLSFELCDIDLRQYLKQKSVENKKIDRKDKSKSFLPIDQCKSLCHQLLNGVAYCHSRRIIHRDLKPQNVLLDKNGLKLKVADFGLARTFTTPTQTNTHEVVTLWYRAPELLLGDHHYTPALDVWSVGCIIGEMITGKAIFHGDSEIDTLFRIFRILGTPVESNSATNDSNIKNDSVPATTTKSNCIKANQTKSQDSKEFASWKGVSKLRYYQELFPLWKRNPLESLEQALPPADSLLLDLLRRLFQYEPHRRPTALEALNHPWFSSL